MFLWLSGRALHWQRKRSWVQFPGNTHTDNKCIIWLPCKSLWINASATCINVSVILNWIIPIIFLTRSAVSLEWSDTINCWFTVGHHYFSHEHTKEVNGPYFNDLSTWSKAQDTGALRACPNPLFLVSRWKKRSTCMVQKGCPHSLNE